MPVLDFSALLYIEYSALEMLIDSEKKLRERGIQLWLVALNPETSGMVQRSSLDETLARERSLFNLQTAVECYPQQVAKHMSGLVSVNNQPD